MNLTLFKTKKGKCDSCHRRPENLEKIILKNYEFWFCEDCINGATGEDLETIRLRDNFVKTYELRKNILKK